MADQVLTTAVEVSDRANATVETAAQPRTAADNLAIRQMEGRTATDKPVLPTLSIGNRDSASNVFSPDCPVTAHLPGMSRKQTTTAVTSEHAVSIAEGQNLNYAVLDLRDPTMTWMRSPSRRETGKTSPYLRRDVEVDLNDGSYGSLIGGSGNFRDTKFSAATWTPVNSDKNPTPAQTQFNFEKTQAFRFGNPSEGAINLPIKQINISDNRWPHTRMTSGLGADYTLRLTDEGERAVTFGIASDGRVTAFSQNLVNNRAFPGTEDGKFLRNLPKLQDVSLMDASDKQLANLNGLKDMRRLHASLANDTTSGEPLSNMSKLEDLRLTGGQIKDFSFLRNKPDMRSLEFASVPISGAQLTNLEGMSKLEHLDLWNSKVDDTAAAQLASMPSLRSLELGHSKITDESLDEIGQLTNLTELRFNGEAVTDPGVARLAGLTALESLSLQETKITDKALETIARLPNLTSINLNLTTITDAGLSHLTRLPNLRNLELALVPITDKGIGQIAKMSHLEELIVDPSKLTDAGLQQLANCKNLKSLTLCGMYFPTKTFTVEGLKALQTKMPQLKITKSI